MDDVKLERRLELSMEGVRFQDLKRWGDASTVLANKGKKLPTFYITPDGNNDISTAEGIYNAKYTTELSYIDNEKKQLQGGPLIAMNIYHFRKNELEVNPNIKQKSELWR